MVNFSDKLKIDINKNVLSDEELIGQFQNDNIYAFEEIVKRYKNRLLNFAYRFFGNIEDAEDIVQETFLKVYKHKNKYRNIAKFSMWIYAITRNIAISEINRKKRKKLLPINIIKYEDKEFEISDKDKGPEEKTDCILIEEMIQNAINNLSFKFREVVILRDIQELSYQEISNIINIPEGTVKSRLNRARLKLQELLSDLI